MNFPSVHVDVLSLTRRAKSSALNCRQASQAHALGVVASGVELESVTQKLITESLMFIYYEHLTTKHVFTVF